MCGQAELRHADKLSAARSAVQLGHAYSEVFGALETWGRPPVQYDTAALSGLRPLPQAVVQRQSVGLETPGARVQRTFGRCLRLAAADAAAAEEARPQRQPHQPGRGGRGRGRGRDAGEGRKDALWELVSEAYERLVRALFLVHATAAGLALLSQACFFKIVPASPAFARSAVGEQHKAGEAGKAGSMLMKKRAWESGTTQLLLLPHEASPAALACLVL